jgi:DNA-binding response OmpR family regulator
MVINLQKFYQTKKNLIFLFLALTSNNSEIEKVKCLEIGIDGYLTKPFKQKYFFEAIINFFQNNKNFDLNH